MVPGVIRMLIGAARTVLTLGFSAALAVRRSELGPPLPLGAEPRLVALRMPGFRHPLHIRVGTSDAYVVRQVFIRREYDEVCRLPDVSFIVDCGANIGATAFLFLHRFPRARLVAIEPDESNVRLCARNLAPFGDRAVVIHAGVWPSRTPLTVERGCGDGREWSFRVRPAREGEEAVPSVTLPQVLAEAGRDTIDLLKIDIEGAETELFRAGQDAWLSRTRNMVVELHGDEAVAAFEAALGPYRHERRMSAESTICTQMSPRRP